MAERIPARLTVGEARRFGLVVGPAFLVLGALSWWRGRLTPPLIFAAIGTALVLLAVVLPAALVPARRIWMAGAMAISKVTTPIFMGIVYFGILTPIALVRRLFGGSPLKSQHDGDSFWVARDLHARKPEDMEHQF